MHNAVAFDLGGRTEICRTGEECIALSRMAVTGTPDMAHYDLYTIRAISSLAYRMLWLRSYYVK